MCHYRLQITVSEMENLDKMVDKLTVKIQNANDCLAEFKKNISAQVFQGQKPYPSVKLIKKEDTFQNDQIQYYEFVVNVVAEHNDESIDVEEKCDEIVMDGLTFKEVKELKQCDEMHNDILEKDINEDTSKPKIIKKINDNEVHIFLFYILSYMVVRNLK